MVYRRKFVATIKIFLYLQYDQKLSNRNWKEWEGTGIAWFFFKILFCGFFFFFFNRDLNHGCLVYMFSLRFSGSKFLINLRRQIRVRKIFQVEFFAGFTVFLFCIYLKLLFRKCVTSVVGCSFLNLLNNRLLTSAFVLVNGEIFIRSNDLTIQCLIACLMN